MFLYRNIQRSLRERSFIVHIALLYFLHKLLVLLITLLSLQNGCLPYYGIALSSTTTDKRKAAGINRVTDGIDAWDYTT